MMEDDHQKMLEEFRHNLAVHIVESCKKAKFHNDPALKAFEDSLRKTYENETMTFKAIKTQKKKREEEAERSRKRTASGGSSMFGFIGKRKSIRVETHDEIGSALRSLLDSSAFAKPPRSVPTNMMNFFTSGGDIDLGEDGKENRGPSTFLGKIPLMIYNKIVGRIFPGPLRVHSYFVHLTSNDTSDFKTAILNAAAEKGIEDVTRTSIDFMLSHSLRTAVEESMAEDHEGQFEIQFQFGRKVLNMYYTLTGKNNLQMSYTILPFIWQLKGVDEWEMCGLFSQFVAKYMSLPTSEVAAAAQSLLLSLDPLLHSHLGDTFNKHRPASEAQFEASFNSGEKKIEGLFREIIDLCFVSLLNTTQLAFVWDHNFLYGWRER